MLTPHLTKLNLELLTNCEPLDIIHGILNLRIVVQYNYSGTFNYSSNSATKNQA